MELTVFIDSGKGESDQDDPHAPAIVYTSQFSSGGPLENIQNGKLPLLSVNLEESPSQNQT